jgi:type I restriction enzyme R subunit
MNEADTCRKLIVPALTELGWDSSPHSIHEQATVTDGRIVPVGDGFVRRKPKKVDYLLRYRRDFPLAVVEAKADYKHAADGLQQAKDYAILLGLKFAYSTNGSEIVEFDFFKGTETLVAHYPSPDDLWTRYQVGSGIQNQAEAQKLLEPFNLHSGMSERYYQRAAINRAVESIIQGKKRLLLTMATGTGKTNVAFQICWKLWKSKWNTRGENRRPRILYLADLNILIDDPRDGIFSAFGDARHKIQSGEIIKSREIYFAIYQAIAEDDRRTGLFRQYPSDFFDLVIVDECHRGSAREESSWRAILNHFDGAVQLGLTATPVRREASDTYQYFGEPIYEYSLRQGIEDGFLAPYRVHRVVTEWDAVGWRPSKGDIDRYGREIPDESYETKDFEKIVALRARTEAIAAHLSDFLTRTNRFDKTIVFCVDQEHALEVRKALVNADTDLVSQYPDYVCRVTADEGDIGRGHLSHFQDVDSKTPSILTTSKMLTTGVDAPTTKNIVLIRPIGSMTEFKQIIGRGTRVRDDYDKLWFNIIDYTGTATQLFADPEFDGDPTEVNVTTIDSVGRETKRETLVDNSESDLHKNPGDIILPPEVEHSKFYFDGGQVRIAAHLVFELDPEGRQLRVVRFTKYAADVIKSLYPTPPELAGDWANPETRLEVLNALNERGISFEQLAEEAGMPEADPFDLICNVAYNAPLRTRRERAARLRNENREFFDRYGIKARQVLDSLIEKYATFGEEQFVLPDVLKVSPIAELGQPAELAAEFGGTTELRNAVRELQILLYAS